MFEYDDEVVSSLLKDNSEFQQLYEKHHDLKEKVKSAEEGTLPLNDVKLGRMKKEKLLTKDKMAALIALYRKDKAG